MHPSLPPPHAFRSASIRIELGEATTAPTGEGRLPRNSILKKVALIIFHGFRADFNMDETCAAGSGECLPHKSAAPCAVMFDTSGVEESTFCAANKTTRYQLL